MRLSDLVEFDQSIVMLKGDTSQINIIGISNSDRPKPNTIVFIKSKKFYKQLNVQNHLEFLVGSFLLIDKKYYASLNVEEATNLLTLFPFAATVDNIDHSMCFLSKPFYDEKFSNLNFQVDGRQMGTCEIHPEAEISQGVFIGEGVKIGKGSKVLPGCTILPNVEIGDHSVLYPNITLYPYTKIGHYCRIHAGTVIGTDGFGYNFFNGAHQKIWHFAGVQIGDEVEIGCNSMVDAGAFYPTIIGSGTKIDNDVQISHNVFVGDHVIICGKTGLAGSVKVMNYCGFGAGAGVAPSAIIEEGAQIAARAVVSENAIMKAGGVYAGHPARPVNEWLKSKAAVRKLLSKKDTAK